MKHMADKKELTAAFMELSRANRDYVLAITRALAFAQNSIKETPPKNKNDTKPA